MLEISYYSIAMQALLIEYLLVLLLGEYVNAKLAFFSSE
jgi:hypothetical protein